MEPISSEYLVQIHSYYACTGLVGAEKKALPRLAAVASGDEQQKEGRLWYGNMELPHLRRLFAAEAKRQGLAAHRQRQI